MLFTREEQLELARQMLQKLNVELSKSGQPGVSDPSYINQTLNNGSRSALLDSLTIRQHTSTRDLLTRLGPLPPHTTLIGVCDDGLPLLFDLSDPTPGAILISGSRGTGKTRLLKAILLASSMLNSTDDFCFYVISSEPGQYRDLYGLDHCIDLLSSYDRAAIELVINLASITEQRRSGRFLGPTTIIAIDDLDQLMNTEEFELTNHLKWLLEHGPRNRIWPIASVQQERVNKLNPKILSGFKTSLIASNGIYQLAHGHRLFGDSLINPFTARIGPQRINFWIPEIF